MDKREKHEKSHKELLQKEKKKKINTTLELAQIIRAIVPKNFKIDPATRTFQAIRIAVNNELKDLARASFAEKIVIKGGIIAVVTFIALRIKLLRILGRLCQERLLQPIGIARQLLTPVRPLYP